MQGAIIKEENNLLNLIEEYKLFFEKNENFNNTIMNEFFQKHANKLDIEPLNFSELQEKLNIKLLNSNELYEKEKMTPSKNNELKEIDLIPLNQEENNFIKFISKNKMKYLFGGFIVFFIVGYLIYDRTILLSLCSKLNIYNKENNLKLELIK